MCYTYNMLISSSYINIPTLQEPQDKSQILNNTMDASEKSSNVNTQDQKDEEKSQKSKELTTGEQQQVVSLQQRDREVRSHEAAHIAAGGSVISGGASFTYEEGPDGRLYAVGGEVPISSSGGSTPQETIAISQQIRAAALAPASPSAQDLKVAASASQMEAQARQELGREKSEEQKEKDINTYSNNQDETKKEDEKSLDISA